MARRKENSKFDKHTRDTAKRRWHKDNPGREDQDLEVHHRVSRKWGRDNRVPNASLRSQNNAKAMTPEEHREHHRNEPTDEEYKTLAQALLGWIGNLF